MKKKITVFTPSYNRANLLPKLLESLEKQSFKDFVLLVIDDGSTDNTKEVIDTWIAKKTFEIRYVYQENQGKHIAFNRAIKEADSELFVEIDSDGIMKAILATSKN